MSLWSRLIGRASAPPPPPALIEPSLPAEKTSDTSLITAGLPWFPIGGMYPSNTGIPVTPMSSLQAAAVYACCKCIGEDIAGLKIQVRRLGLDGLWVTDLRHPLNRLFRRPNTWQTAFQFWAYVLVSYCLRGNAFVVIVRGLDGQVRELVPVSPDFVTMHPPIEGRGRIWYTITSRYLGGVFKIPNDDVIHMRNPVTLDGYLGASPIMCAQDVIGLALATQQHGAVLFRQGGQIAGVLKHPGKIGKEATDNIAASWADTHGGVQNAHKITVLEEGMTFEKIALTNFRSWTLQPASIGCRRTRWASMAAPPFRTSSNSNSNTSMIACSRTPTSWAGCSRISCYSMTSASSRKSGGITPPCCAATKRSAMAAIKSAC
jgi:hypothetical protein